MNILYTAAGPGCPSGRSGGFLVGWSPFKCILGRLGKKKKDTLTIILSIVCYYQVTTRGGALRLEVPSRARAGRVTISTKSPG